MVCLILLLFLSPFKHEMMSLTTISPTKVDALNTKYSQIYHQQTFQPYSVNGQVTGQYKNAGTFSYVRIYGAGHEVPAYKVSCSFFVLLLFLEVDEFTHKKFGNLAYGEAAAQFFTQIMRNESLYST